jgi:hypothetical protein
VSGTDLAAHPRLDELMSRCCECCVNDAGFQSGMAGASRCELVERALRNAFGAVHAAAEWQSGPDGVISCSAFDPDDPIWPSMSAPGHGSDRAGCADQSGFPDLARRCAPAL